jgi:hypothetical protein
MDGNATAIMVEPSGISIAESARPASLNGE